MDLTGLLASAHTTPFPPDTPPEFHTPQPGAGESVASARRWPRIRRNKSFRG